MSHGFRENSRRALCLLAVGGLLAVAVPGCGDAGTSSKQEGAGTVAPNVQDSNKNMEDFMKSQSAKTKQ